MFLYHTQRRSTVGRTPLDEWSARRRDLYLTTHDTHNRQISMPPVGFEPTISAGERPQAAHLLTVFQRFFCITVLWRLNQHFQNRNIFVAQQNGFRRGQSATDDRHRFN